jgi:hypothetical protein
VRFVIELLPVLALIAGAALLVRRGWRAVAERRAGSEPWRVAVRSVSSNRLVVEVTRPGEPAQVIGELDPADRDFDAKLYELEFRARNITTALNATRRAIER